MTGYILETYKNGRYLGHTVPWIFETRAAAEWYAANRCDHGAGYTYRSTMWPVYTLGQVQEFTA